MPCADLLAGGITENIKVVFQGGTYLLRETVVFGLKDSAAAGQTITYAAAEGQTPVFTPAIKLQGWQKASEPPPDLPPEAHSHVWVAPIPYGIKTFRVLYDGADRLTRAAEAYFEHRTPIEPSWRFTGTEDEHQTVIVPVGQAKCWTNRDDVEVVIRSMARWNMSILGIESVDVEKSTLRLRGATSYVISKPGGCVIENTFRGLDAPGKWVLDSKAGKVYLWPKRNEPGADIAAPGLVEMVRIEGRIDYAGPADTPVRGIVFQNLTFMQNDRPVVQGGRTGWGLQHEWEEFDTPSAMLRLRGAEECVVENCRFVEGGSAGVRLDLHAQKNRIVGNEMAGLGGVGILLAGYGPGTKNVNKGNEIVDNWIHHTGQLFWHAPGIFVWQSGENLIAHNRLYDLPYTAIVVSGRIAWDPTGLGECSRTVRWHEVGAVTGAAPWQQREPFLHGRKNRIEANDIYRVMRIMGDGNGIYISGTGGGNYVFRNYIHDCPDENFGEGIRCDDDQHATVIEENVCARFGGMATGICPKGVNHILNNVIARPLTPTARGLIAIELSPADGSRIQGNIIYALRKDQKFYYIDTYYPGTKPPHMLEIEMDSNLYFNAADPSAGEQHLHSARSCGKDLHGVSAAPLFVNAEQGDFRLRPDSPALPLGIRVVDIRQAGPLTHWRKGK